MLQVAGADVDRENTFPVKSLLDHVREQISSAIGRAIFFNLLKGIFEFCDFFFKKKREKYKQKVSPASLQIL